MYNIPDNFKVMSASLHPLDNAAHWYQSVKYTDAVESWDKFSVAVQTEFDLNIHRDCMRELLVLKQMGTVQEYRQAFNQLVYKVRLYEGHVSETLLVTRFILGLKQELRAAVEMQMPLTVQAASQLAQVQEALLARSKIVKQSLLSLLLQEDRQTAMTPCLKPISVQVTFGRLGS